MINSTLPDKSVARLKEYVLEYVNYLAVLYIYRSQFVFGSKPSSSTFWEICLVGLLTTTLIKHPVKYEQHK